MNKSDSERISSLLQQQGHKPAKNIEQADLIVINACSVRQSAIDRVYSKIYKIQQLKTKNYKLKTILAGCVLETDKKKLQDKVDEFWSPNKYFCTSSPRQSALSQRKSAFIPIMTGCNNFCSYCVVPYTRGREKSRLAEDIMNEVKNLIKNGCKEIMLLGQNVNSYSSKLKVQNSKCKTTTKNSKLFKKESQLSVISYQLLNAAEINFPQLLRLINDIPGNFQIKFLTSHPKDMSDELINSIAECKKVSHEIHLPIQSGDNTILRKMNRKYTVAHYKKLIKKIRAKIPDAIISTDIIVGFPEETKKQFKNTVKLFKEIKFNKAYIAMYSPRPGTAAYKLKNDVPQEEKKRRWKILENLVNKKNCLTRQ